MVGIFPSKIEESKPVLPKPPKSRYLIEGTDPAPIVPLYGRVSFFGETPEVTFDQSIRYYERTPQIKLAIDTTNEMIFGTDFIINVDDGYQKAKQIIDTWNEQVNFYEKMQALGITFLVTGNALLEKLDQNTMQNVLEVDMTTILGKHRDETGQRVEYYIQQVPGYMPQQLGANIKSPNEHLVNGDRVLHLGESVKEGKTVYDAHVRFVEFNLTGYARKDWGRSMFYSLAVPRMVNGVMCKPLIEDLWEIEDAMSRIFHNYASPMMFITYTDADDEFIDKKAAEFKKMKPGDALLGRRKPDFDIIETDARAKFDTFISHMDSTFEVGTQFSNQLFTAGYTARASSQTTHDLINKKIRKIQKYICDKIKNEIYKPLLKLNGFKDSDINQMNLVISFKNDDFTEFIPQDVINMVMNGVMTPNEARNWAKGQGLDLFEDDWAMRWHKDWYLGNTTQGPVGDSALQEPDTPPAQQYFAPVDNSIESCKSLCESCKEGQHAFCSKKRCRCKITK